MRRTALEKKIAQKYEEYCMLADQAKELYDAKDKVLEEIGKLVKPKPIRSIQISKEELLEIRDVSKGSDLILGWGHASVKRYEIKVRKA